jgi:hypothetical protein
LNPQQHARQIRHQSIPFQHRFPFGGRQPTFECSISVVHQPARSPVDLSNPHKSFIFSTFNSDQKSINKFERNSQLSCSSASPKPNNLQ